MRCRPTAVLPVPGAPCTHRAVRSGAGEPVAAAQQRPFRCLAGGAVERGGDGRAPVDDQRCSFAVVHVAPPDVDVVGVWAAGRRRRLSGGGLVDTAGRVVQPAEEQRNVGEVDQGLGAQGAGPPQRRIGDLVGDRVAQRRLCGEDVLAHAPQRGTGLGEEGAFGVDLGVDGRIRHAFGMMGQPRLSAGQRTLKGVEAAARVPPRKAVRFVAILSAYERCRRNETES